MTSKESKKVVNKTQIIYISCTKAIHWNSLYKFISLDLPQMPLVVFVAQILRSSPLFCNMCRISLDSAFLNWFLYNIIFYNSLYYMTTFQQVSPYGICASTVPYHEKVTLFSHCAMDSWLFDHSCWIRNWRDLWLNLLNVHFLLNMGSFYFLA